MSSEELAEIERRALESSQGLTLYSDEWVLDLVYDGGLGCRGEDLRMNEADARFIVTARADVLALVARIRELEAEIGDMPA